MEYRGVIRDFNFMPMVDVVPSILNSHIEIPELGITLTFTHRGTIENLAGRFGFKISGPDTWDFSGYTGRECLINQDENGFAFVRFIKA